MVLHGLPTRRFRSGIHPTAGAVIALLMAHGAPPLQQAILTASGGAVALVSHLVKGGLRLIVNTSPEPVTTIGVSVGETSPSRA